MKHLKTPIIFILLCISISACTPTSIEDELSPYTIEDTDNTDNDGDQKDDVEDPER